MVDRAYPNVPAAPGRHVDLRQQFGARAVHLQSFLVGGVPVHGFALLRGRRN